MSEIHNLKEYPKEFQEEIIYNLEKPCLGPELAKILCIPNNLDLFFKLPPQYRIQRDVIRYYLILWWNKYQEHIPYYIVDSVTDCINTLTVELITQIDSITEKR